MDLGLKDRVAIVTGSSKGLGFASARALIAEGCRVVICARTPDTLQEARRRLAEIGGESRVLAVASDVSQEEGAKKVVDQAVTTFGGIDVLVNNVGSARGGGLLDTTDELWGLMRNDGTLRPAFVAYQTAARYLGGADRVEFAGRERARWPWPQGGYLPNWQVYLVVVERPAGVPGAPPPGPAPDATPTPGRGLRLPWDPDPGPPQPLPAPPAPGNVVLGGRAKIE